MTWPTANSAHFLTILSCNMGNPAWIPFFILLPLFLSRAQSDSTLSIRGEYELADTPPKGWNSYDSFAWIISEEEFLQNAEIVSNRLLKYGYQYVVVDYLWYRKLVNGSSRDSYGYDVLDEWGRVIPDPGRWPSSSGGNGFKEVAQKVHDMGLKFGIHQMRGISTQAVDTNTAILDVAKGSAYEEAGRQWRARDIGLRKKTCAWMPHGFMSVNTDLEAGRAFLRSIYTQYAGWGVDFVKLDCVFGDDFDLKEIMTVSELLKELDRPVVFSISPGTHVTPDMAELVKDHVNMYRITGDDWDTWPDVEAHFDIVGEIAASHLIGANGLHGTSWPDLDMLPLGWLTNSYGNIGPYRKCNLTLDEQKTQMTLWSIGRSPLIFGGDLRNTDEYTFNLITNPTLLEIDSFSANNMEFPYIRASQDIRSQDVLTPIARSLETFSTSSNKVGLTSCNIPKAKGWVVQNQEEGSHQLCWKNFTEIDDETSFCIYQRKSLQQLGGNIYNQYYQANVHLLAEEGRDLCLDTSGRKLTASEMQIWSFSPCEWKASQMWELNKDGTLMSNYSGLCLVVDSKKDSASAGGGRSWIATGRRGEVYLSFFNLNEKSMVISANIQDMEKVLPSGSMGKGSCKCTEVWTGKDFGVVDTAVSMMVSGHGCALFILDCN